MGLGTAAKMPGADIIWQCSGLHWTIFVASVFLGTIGFCYGACLADGHCTAGPWNTISHSWEQPPGSFISRFVVGWSSDMLVVFHALLLFALTGEGFGPVPRVMFGMGAFACFCLSWVGAICDAPGNPQCLGDDTIHSAAAVGFFVISDVVIVIYALLPNPTPTLSLSVAAANWTATVVRLLLYLELMVLEDCCPSLLFFVEVAEVLTMLAWYVTVAVSRFDGYALVATAAAPSASSAPAGATEVLLRARHAAAISAGLVVATLASTYAIGEADHMLPAPPAVPTISEMFVYRPSNWLSRWGLVQAACFALVGNLFSAAAAAGGKWGRIDYVKFALQCLGTLGMAGMGCVDVKEDQGLHQAMAAVFYGASNAHMVLSIGGLAARGLAEVATVPAVALASAGVGLTCGLLRYGWLPSSGAADPAALGWTNMVAIVAYGYFSCTRSAATATMAVTFVGPARRKLAGRRRAGSIVVAVPPQRYGAVDDGRVLLRS